MQKEIGWLLQEKYKGIETPQFKKDVARLKKGEPLDHIIGFVEFLGCKILVNNNVLIPRFETEFWVQKAIDQIKGEKVRVLDMFSGSGCIGISIVRHIKNTQVVFADSEKSCVDQIQKNCALNKIPSEHYKIIQSDIFSNIEGKFDYIFANPPYIPTRKKSGLQKSVLDYEPHAALFGGVDGLFYVQRFLVEAKNFLNPNGKIYIEFDSPQKPAIEKLLKKLDYKTWEFHKDQYGKQRWVVIQ